MATQHSSLAGLSVELSNNRIIDFEVLICELICCKVMGHLLEETILQQLTSGLEIIFTFQLHLFTDNESGVLVVEYRHCNPSSNATPGHIPTTEVFVTDDLASQAIVVPGHGDLDILLVILYMRVKVPSVRSILYSTTR